MLIVTRSHLCSPESNKKLEVETVYSKYRVKCLFENRGGVRRNFVSWYRVPRTCLETYRPKGIFP